MKKTNINNSKGFTLIELLVVIAIIGILASVVLASLNSARGKGSDASIKANLANIRSQAALYYDDHTWSYGTPSTTCSGASSLFLDPTIAAAIAQVETQNGAYNVSCSSTSDNYAIASALKSNGAKNVYCIDSNGKGKIEVVSTAGDSASAISGSLCL